MTGEAHHAEMGALLALLASRLPTTEELTGAATSDAGQGRCPLDTGFDSERAPRYGGDGWCTEDLQRVHRSRDRRCGEWSTCRETWQQITNGSWIGGGP